jgi:Fe-S-cluster containining protein
MSEKAIKWACVKCGCCCFFAGKHLNMDRGYGACIHLTKDNLCDIYETRPDICNTKNFSYSDEFRMFACKQLRIMRG